MKKVALLSITLNILMLVFAQQREVDSLNALIKTDVTDTIKAKHLYALAKVYMHSDPVKTLQLAQQMLIIAQANKNYKLTRTSLNLIANMYTIVGDFTKGLEFYVRLLRLAENENDSYYLIQTGNNIGNVYIEKGDYNKALEYLIPAEKMLGSYLDNNKGADTQYLVLAAYLYENIGHANLYFGKPNIAEENFKLEKQYVDRSGFRPFLSGYYNDMGMLYSARGNVDSAVINLRRAIAIGEEINDIEMMDRSYTYLAKLYIKSNKPDSAIVHAKKALALAQQGNYLQHVLEISKILYNLYDEKNDIPAAYRYYKLTTAANDSINSQDKIRELVSIDFEERQHQQDIAAAKAEYRNTVRTYIFTGVIFIVILIAFMFRRNAVARKKANVQLQKQKEEIEVALEQLRQAQTQLIQSEKMASLGELTAGIAHEIQNPLNFVNNFSDVNQEMIEELEAELKTGNIEEGLAFTGIIRQNEAKINHHGKRADLIVKGMLQHSRSSAGERQATNLNLLADEFLKLSFHGLRAKDKSFNTDIETYFDDKLPEVSLVRQDMGRVLLNIFNNAFYAVNEKAKKATAYKPVVTVTTATQNNKVIIKIADNGIGIPDAFKDKIMQPFFTTKPTGQGTGLGLSLSYDIVVKGHGGTLSVESREGDGATFIIILPVTISVDK